MTTTYLLKEKKKAGFRLSYRFDVPAICFEGVYYFPQNIEEYKCRDGTIRKGVQAVFNDRGKLRQDTFYKTDRFLNNLTKYAKENNISLTK